jgi:hypothetical protein
VVPHRRCFADARRTGGSWELEGVKRSGLALADFLPKGDVGLRLAQVAFLVAALRLLPCRTGHYWYWYWAFEDWGTAKWDNGVVLYTSASRCHHHTSKTTATARLQALSRRGKPIAYLEEPGCRSAEGLAVAAEVPAAGNQALLLGSPEALAASWHTGGSEDPVDATWTTLGGPRSLAAL